MRDAGAVGAPEADSLRVLSFFCTNTRNLTRWTMNTPLRAALTIAVALSAAFFSAGRLASAGGGVTFAHLSVVATAPTDPAPGAFDITITVQSLGGPAADTTLTTTLAFGPNSSGSSLTGDTTGCGALTATGFSCNFGTLGTGATRTLTISVFLNCGGSVDLGASVTTSTPSITSGEDQSQLSRDPVCHSGDSCYDQVTDEYLCDNPCYNPDTGEYDQCEECVPDAPNAGPDQFVDEGDTVALDGQLGEICLVPTTSWTQIAGPPVTLSDPYAAAPTFTAPNVNSETTLTFRFAADAQSDTVDVVVSPVGAPILSWHAVRHTTGGDVPYIPGTWSREQVTVYFTCSDDAGGLVNSFPPQKNFEGDGTFHLPRPGWSCSDKDGHVAEVEPFQVMIDRHAPTCSVSPLVQYVPSDGAMHTRSVTVSGQDGVLPASALVFKLVSVSGGGVAGWSVGSSTPSLDVKGTFLGVPGPAHVITYQVTDPAGWSQTCSAKVATAR